MSYDDLWDDPEEEERDFTEDEIEALTNLEDLSDYDDEIFGDSGFNVDPDKNPFGWDITDTIDWESIDYE